MDKETLERCRCGDKASFRIIVQQYQRLVFGIALRILCDEEDAKDIVQETFIRVWSNLAKYDPSKNFTTWIYTIATRLCLDKAEQKSHFQATAEDEEILQNYMEDKTPDRLLENSQLAAIIRQLTEKLSPKQRIVFTLINLENQSTEEVEKITGMDAEKIKSNLYVAKQKMREQLKRLGYE